MIQVSVPTNDFRRLQGIAKASGKAYDMAFQTVWAHTFTREGVKNPYPEKVEVILEKDQSGAPMPYQPGEYQLHPSSLYIDERGKLAVAPRLIPLKPKAA